MPGPVRSSTAVTGTPAAGTGHATVKLADGKATARRIDLRADVPTAATVALPAFADANDDIAGLLGCTACGGILILIPLMIVALILVGYGMRVDSPTLRGVGIAFLVAAFALRFIKPPVSGE